MNNEENYFSEKNLTSNKWYNIILRVHQESEVIHKISMFVNGFVDL